MLQIKSVICGCIKYQYVKTLMPIIICCLAMTSCSTKTELNTLSAQPPVETGIMRNSALQAPHGDRYVIAALNYLSQEMDYFHKRTIVFDDFESAGERFFPSGWMKGPNGHWPEQNDGRLKFTYPAEGAHQGASCLRVEWRPPREDEWVAVAWQYPENNWGTSPGLNLQGATWLRFWAKGETGREVLTFKFGIVHKDGMMYNDSCREISTGLIRLSNDWREYEIDLSRKDLTNIISGFCFAISKDRNPDGCVFYLDDISINHSRLQEPRLIRSYHIGERILDENRHLRNTCFVYDNALAVCAFLSSPSSDYHQRAQLIADAFVQLTNTEPDGCIRNAYANGDLFVLKDINSHMELVPRTPGHMHYNDDGTSTWYEDAYSIEVDCGNMAWAMLALLNVWKDDGRKTDSVYLATAKKIGEWILANAKDSRQDSFGFYGGKEWNPKTGMLKPVLWKSTEHNIDLAAVFALLADADPNIENRTKWREASEYAKKFVGWAQEQGNSYGGLLITGTVKGTDEPATTLKPIDPQTWSVLAFPLEKQQYEDALNWAIDKCRVEVNGLWGFQFSAGECDSIWPEGTAQMALALRALGRNDEADSIIQQLRLIMDNLESNKETAGAMPAAYPVTVVTGLGWNYDNLPHLGATAWYLLASNSWNPYGGQKVQ